MADRGITRVTDAETSPEQVTLNEKLPGGASLGVSVKDVAPNE